MRSSKTSSCIVIPYQVYPTSKFATCSNNIMNKEMVHIGTEVIVNGIWCVVNGINGNRYSGVDEDGGEVEFTIEQVTAICP